jgi:hypothetical protein
MRLSPTAAAVAALRARRRVAATVARRHAAAARGGVDRLVRGDHRVWAPAGRYEGATISFSTAIFSPYKLSISI